MAWSARAQVLCLVIAGFAGGITASPYDVVLHVGDTLPASVVTGLEANVSCYLDTPQGDVIEFRPENNAPDRIIYVETFISYCGANITDLTKKDDGEWTIYYIDNDGQRNAVTYNLTVTEATEESEESEPIEEKEEEKSEEEEDITEWLTVIHHSTRIGLSVDISLSRRELEKEETFTLTTPQDTVVQLEHLNMPGVTVHSSSNFVAGRVTIGPMDESLIGRWTLCGEIDGGKTARRCQSVAISWNNLQNPTAEWPTTILDKRDIVTNYLATVETGVGSLGSLMTCHLVTPDGEDLIITRDSGYPGITLVATHDTYACRVNLGPIHKQFIGDWILYASFRSVLNSGVTETRLPLHLFLYDENYPYRQAYNVTTLAPVTRVVNLGTSTTLEVPGSGDTDSCELKSPSGQIFDLQTTTESVTFLETNSRVSCAVSIGPIGQETLGDWEIISKFNDRGIFTENRQTISIIQEDPENPIIEDHRTVLTRDVIYFNTNMGAEHSVVVDANALWIYTTESCHLKTPRGLQYTLMDGFNIPGIEITENDNNRCSIKINVESEDLIGEWTLISREQRSSDAVEVRQPFTIFVQEEVDASASQVTVTEGNNLHLRLANPTNLHESCKLYDPSGTERTDREVDATHVDTCGFIVKNVENNDNGVWQIRFGTGISYRANVNVVVKDLWETTQDYIVLTRGRPVNDTIGPETTVYCKLTDPTESVVFEGHGRCNMALDRVTKNHAGTWVMNVGLLGNLLTRTHLITVEVRGSEDKPTVTTFVAKEQPEVTLKCSVPIEYEVRSCLFREPSGNVIIVNDGVAEDRYISHGSGTIINGNVTTHECGLRITNPVVSDLGLWRCAVETDHETYYGFLTVLCPWAMQDPATAAAVISEPTLKAHKESITHLEGESLTMSCSIQSPIQYCYFRRPDGTTYSVYPGVSSNEYEYVGAGLDAGECGIRFSSLQAQESGHWTKGRWSCHVGVANNSQPEQRADMLVYITSPFWLYQYQAFGVLVIDGNDYQGRAFEYCRYVRIDGVGFKSTLLPDARYSLDEALHKGHCGLTIENATILDHHPWTVAAKVFGKDEELIGVTSPTMAIPETPEVATGNYIWWWCTSIFVGIFLICLGILVIPPKNRRNTIATATLWRDSIRRSFTKKPLPDDDGNRTTTMSA